MLLQLKSIQSLGKMVIQKFAYGSFKYFVQEAAKSCKLLTKCQSVEVHIFSSSTNSS